MDLFETTVPGEQEPGKKSYLPSAVDNSEEYICSGKSRKLAITKPPWPMHSLKTKNELEHLMNCRPRRSVGAGVTKNSRPDGQIGPQSYTKATVLGAHRAPQVYCAPVVSGAPGNVEPLGPRSPLGPKFVLISQKTSILSLISPLGPSSLYESVEFHDQIFRQPSGIILFGAVSPRGLILNPSDPITTWSPTSQSDLRSLLEQFKPCVLHSPWTRCTDLLLEPTQCVGSIAKKCIGSEENVEYHELELGCNSRTPWDPQSTLVVWNPTSLLSFWVLGDPSVRGIPWAQKVH